MTASTAVQIPGYLAGTWDIDPAHSTVGFSVRHMMVSKVRGYFRTFSGVLVGLRVRAVGGSAWALCSHSGQASHPGVTTSRGIRGCACWTKATGTCPA